jgi:hypothetical protein
MRGSGADPILLRKRVLALVQILLVLIVCGTAWVFGPSVAPQPAGSEAADRLAFAVKWLVVPGLLLLVFVSLTAFGRFFIAEAFDGTRKPANRFIEINLRVTRNTLEQTVLAAIAWCGLAIALPAEQLGMIPVLAALFAIGRILFWAGYQFHPVARATGFGITALPTGVALIWLAWRTLVPQ